MATFSWASHAAVPQSAQSGITSHGVGQGSQGHRLGYRTGFATSHHVSHNAHAVYVLPAGDIGSNAGTSFCTLNTVLTQDFSILSDREAEDVVIGADVRWWAQAYKQSVSSFFLYFFSRAQWIADWFNHMQVEMALEWSLSPAAAAEAVTGTSGLVAGGALSWIERNEKRAGRETSTTQVTLDVGTTYKLTAKIETKVLAEIRARFDPTVRITRGDAQAMTYLIPEYEIFIRFP